MGNYNVVFQYTKETGGYDGVITWGSFQSKEDFDKWYTPDLEKRQRVIDKGVTQERAVELAKTTPRACRLTACLEEATMSDGSINKDILDMRLKMLSFMEILDKK
ncbi:MAG: hypothetical protein AABX88_03055 [Nanoarchaeota archaeon]